MMRDRETEQILDLLKPEQRRKIVAVLKEEGRTSINELSKHLNERDPTQAKIQLAHVHLPKLEDRSVIVFDKNRGAIERGEQFEDVEEVFDALEKVTPTPE